MGTPCVYTTVEQMSSVSLVLCHRQGRPCVPGSILGTFDSAPWLLDRLLAQLDSYLTSRFEHHWDNLRCLTG